MFAAFKNLRALPKRQLVQCGFDVVVIRNKHFDPKFKWHRGKKYIPVDIPDFQEKFTKEKFRTHLKELGIAPPRFWKDRPLTITTLGEIVDPYEPPEADGKASLSLNKEGLKSLVASAKGKKDHLKAMREIKSYDGQFNIKFFPQEAHDLYVKAHTVLMSKDPEKLSEYVTEKAIIEMLGGLKLRTLRWKFIESLEPPTVVRVRTAPAVIDSNIFAQITVRFHTKQCLAIYDRFGRLFYGSEIVPKDVLEYVVFEKQIVNEYGVWRLHGKIIPDWMPPADPAPRTYRVEQPKEEHAEEEDEFIEEDRETEEMEENVAETGEVKENR